MDHKDLFIILNDKISRNSEMTPIESGILRDVIAGIAKKDNSIYECYTEIITSGEYPTLSKVKEIAQKYSVPELYAKHIEDRFGNFKSNIKLVCRINTERRRIGDKPGTDVDKWVKGGKPMFGSTEATTIKKIGGLDVVCQGIHTVGYYVYLMKVFRESATDVSKRKYSSLIVLTENQIENKS